MVALAVLASPMLARADAPTTEATRHIERGSALHKQGKLVEALAELETAYTLDPRPQLLFAMGQIHVQLGECPQAITYYERFLATKPSAEVAAVTSEAIEACKTNPPPVAVAPVPEPAPVQAPEVKPLPAPLAPRRGARPWYSDRVGDALVAGGVISGVVGLVLWRGAVSDRDHADSTATYEQFAALIDSAHGKQTAAIVFGIAATALIAAGGVHLVLHHRATEVVVAPAGGGGAVTWLGRF